MTATPLPPLKTDVSALPTHSRPEPSSPAGRFFASAIQQQRLAHAFVLKGPDCATLYQLALQLGQVVNCQQPTRPDQASSLLEMACGHCVSCRWAMQNTHPAILTVSRLTFLTDEKDPNPQLLTSEALQKLGKQYKQGKKSPATMIKTDQIAVLISQLQHSSEYTRVIIFTDAEPLPVPSPLPAPYDWQVMFEDAAAYFHPRPLTPRIFNAGSVNRFLKTLEEPPARTLFFYLAHTEEQLLDTIVSRCQVIPCPPDHPLLQDALSPAYGDFLASWWGRLQADGRADVFALLQEFEHFFLEDAQLTGSQALAMLQHFLHREVRQAASDSRAVARMSRLQGLLERAITQLDAKTKESAVLINFLMEVRHVTTSSRL